MDGGCPGPMNIRSESPTVATTGTIQTVSDDLFTAVRPTIEARLLSLCWHAVIRCHRLLALARVLIVCLVC